MDEVANCTRKLIHFCRDGEVVGFRSMIGFDGIRDGIRVAQRLITGLRQAERQGQTGVPFVAVSQGAREHDFATGSIETRDVEELHAGRVGLSPQISFDQGIVHG